MLWFLSASKAASMSSCVHDFEPWWCELDCPLCPLELFSPESDWPELPDGISPNNSGVIIIMLSLSAAFFELTLARSDMWLSMSIVSEESIVCSVSNLILTLSQFWISANKLRETGMTRRCCWRFAQRKLGNNFRDDISSPWDSRKLLGKPRWYLRIDKRALSKAKLDAEGR